jgi:hypothetical protein
MLIIVIYASHRGFALYILIGLAKNWYVVQLFPAPQTIIQQLNTAVTYFIWKESIFRVPLSVLRAGKMEAWWM